MKRLELDDLSSKKLKIIVKKALSAIKGGTGEDEGNGGGIDDDIPTLTVNQGGAG